MLLRLIFRRVLLKASVLRLLGAEQGPCVLRGQGEGSPALTPSALGDCGLGGKNR